MLITKSICTSSMFFILFFSSLFQLNKVIFTNLVKLDPSWEEQLDPDPQQIMQIHSPDCLESRDDDRLLNNPNLNLKF